jgi:hypothetical protein
MIPTNAHQLTFEQRRSLVEFLVSRSKVVPLDKPEQRAAAFAEAERVVNTMTGAQLEVVQIEMNCRAPSHTWDYDPYSRE